MDASEDDTPPPSGPDGSAALERARGHAAFAALARLKVQGRVRDAELRRLRADAARGYADDADDRLHRLRRERRDRPSTPT
ncbi:hypothetical protein [Nonomuraea sp. NPDC050783]|uniref:hypothetical protein n=1 Tax=Nonomuraea sp. NPDC050783 TaxID=3154634 RepID=UPI003467CC32